MSFDDIPDQTFLEEGRLPVAQLASMAKREGQSTLPIYRVHRWFARRLGSQFRSILAALTLGNEANTDDFWKRYLGQIPLDGASVLDPFMGGGTSLVESARCGADVTGREIDPVATSIARAELTAGMRPNLKQAALNVTGEVRNQIWPLHQTTVEDTKHRVLHHFWTQVVECKNDDCSKEIELHPHYRLAYDREENVQWAFCKTCHRIQRLSRDRKRLHCRTCSNYTRIDEGTKYWNTVTCPQCHKEQRLVPEDGPREEPPRWKLFAQEYLDGEGRRPSRRFKKATEEDKQLYEHARNRFKQHEQKKSFVPERPIPPNGRQDGRPIIHGVRKYSHLFNFRQLLHLSLLGRRISQMENPTDRRLVGLAFSEHLTTNCMYTGYAFGYRRTSPLFSFHGFRHIVRPVEINPWLDGIGRGTFPNALRKIERASEYANAPYDYAPNGEKSRSEKKLKCTLLNDDAGDSSDEEHVSKESSVEAHSTRDVSTADIKVTSSTRLSELQDASLDLVLTDPPYFDNLNYSELSDFYLAWHQSLRIASGEYDDSKVPAPLVTNMAVSESDCEDAAEEYERDLTAVYGEIERVLKPGAPCVFTYHHNDDRAWIGVCRALIASGLNCTSVFPMRGEGQGGLHSYDQTIRWDSVFTLRKVQTSGGRSRDTDRTMPKPSAAVVPENAVRDGVKRVGMYVDMLSEEGVSFREPDQINLLRAFLVQDAVNYSRTGGEKGSPVDTVALSSALSYSREAIETGNLSVPT
jgi:adenine-specific DNA methylase